MTLCRDDREAVGRPARGAAPRTRRGLRSLATVVFRTRRPAAAPSLPVTTPSANGTHHQRPAPSLRWTDPRSAPTGDFAATAVPNRSLGPDAVPGHGDPWDVVSDFCLSYDGYAYWDDLPELANRVLQGWTHDHSLPRDLDELRACLFYEQRRWHHFGEEPSGRSALFMGAALDALRALVAPTVRGVERVPDPRVAIAPEAHVRIVAAPTQAHAAPAPEGAPAPASGPNRRPLPVPVATLHPLPGPGARPHVDAHITLVTSIEAQARRDAMASDDDGIDLEPLPGPWSTTAMASAMSRHPSVRARHPSAHRAPPVRRGAASAAVADLRPMPSAEPLPKPPVITQRARPGHATRPSGHGPAVITALRPSVSPPVPGVVAFHHDDAGYVAWVAGHPDGFVLNTVRSGPSAPAVLHRVVCGAVRQTVAADRRPTGRTPKVCAPSADALRSWSGAQGSTFVCCQRCLG